MPRPFPPQEQSFLHVKSTFKIEVEIIPFPQRIGLSVQQVPPPVPGVWNRNPRRSYDQCRITLLHPTSIPAQACPSPRRNHEHHHHHQGRHHHILQRLGTE